MFATQAQLTFIEYVLEITKGTIYHRFNENWDINQNQLE